MTSVAQDYENLKSQMLEVVRLETIGALLEYDEQTILPPAAAAYRGEQTSMIAGLQHEKATSPFIGDVLKKLEDNISQFDENSPERINVREWRREYDKQVKIPRSLVEEITLTGVNARSAWLDAKQKNDYALFKPHLEKTFELQLKVAEHLGYENEPYDALLDQYEPGIKTDEVQSVLFELRDAIIPLVKAIVDSDQKPQPNLLYGDFPSELQHKLASDAATMIGYDFTRGILGKTAHPFCSTLGPNDVRITTRDNSEYFDINSVMHEAGHGIYEQNLPTEHFGTPLGTYASLGVHESQSRFWENQIGRSRPFWEKIYAQAQDYFAPFKSVELDDFLFALNEAKPSLIRIESDELTYNLHILIRFEIERGLINKEISFDELPEVWNSKMKEYLGIDVPTDSEGCMQDIHWALGAVGYFPTYSLGNIYSAQFANAAEAELGKMEVLIGNGDFIKIRDWFAQNVHSKGRQYLPAKLVEVVTGKKPSAAYLIAYLKNRFGKLYNINL